MKLIHYHENIWKAENTAAAWLKVHERRWVCFENLDALLSRDVCSYPGITPQEAYDGMVSFVLERERRRLEPPPTCRRPSDYDDSWRARERALEKDREWARYERNRGKGWER